MTTPRLTHHARERCAEMEISTKVAKRIIQNADCVRPGKPGSNAFVATSDEHPDYAVVFFRGEDDDIPVVSTVVFRTPHDYVRNGETFTPLPRKGETRCA